MGDCLMATVQTMPLLPVPPESYEAVGTIHSTKILKEMLGEVRRTRSSSSGYGQGSVHPDPDVRVRRRRWGTAAVVSLAAAAGALRTGGGPAPAPGEASKGKPPRAGAHLRPRSCPSRECVMYLSKHRGGRGHEGGGTSATVAGRSWHPTPGRRGGDDDGEEGHIMVVDDEEIVPGFADPAGSRRTGTTWRPWRAARGRWSASPRGRGPDAGGPEDGPAWTGSS